MSSEENEEEIIELEGEVYSINIKVCKTVIVKDCDENIHKLIIPLDKFFPVEKGDLIKCKYSSKNNQLSEVPLVILSRDDEQILQFFFRILTKSGYSLYQEMKTMFLSN